MAVNGIMYKCPDKDLFQFTHLLIAGTFSQARH